MMKKTLLLSTAISAILFAGTVTAQSPSDSCDTESIQKMSPEGTTIGFAAREWGGCRVGGYVTTQNPGPNRVLFTLFLPNDFSGRYVYLGVGGSAGSLPRLPTDLMDKGYALAGSDGGTGAKSSADYSFVKDPAKALDYSWRGVHVSAEATQQITRTYFDRQDIHRYISGCSGGGNMGMTNARRFGGEQFDGFLVGATAWAGDAYMVHVYAIARHLQNHPEGWISPDLLMKAQAEILEEYDGSDGVVDGIIADQRHIDRFDTGVLERIGFTPAQIDTFELISQPREYSGPGLDGDVVFPGFPITNVGSWSGFLTGQTPPPWSATDAQPASGQPTEVPPYAHLMADTNVRPLHPGLDYWSVTDDRELTSLATNAGEKIPYDDPMDYSKFIQSGAKMIFYHGVDDPNISYLASIANYERLLKRFPEADSSLSAVMVPGFAHCRGGLGPSEPEADLLEALITWVEEGDKPDAVPSNREYPSAAVERTFLLCAEPEIARLKKPDLDPRDGNSWTCE